MRILVTNDDGINAEGLGVLERVAGILSDDVYVVAPETDQSGVAHSLSLNDPVRLRKLSARRYAVKGTPTDCVIMALRSVILDTKPDLILSGVNRGQNAAEDVTYSGTIAAAMEGTMLTVPSIALSQAHGGRGAEPMWECAETHAPSVIRRILAEGLAPGVLANVNFPNCSSAQVQGIVVTKQGRRDTQLLRLEERIDARGNPYFWIGFGLTRSVPQPGSDLEALAEHKISVTPLRIDLTDEPTVARFSKAFG